MRRMIPLLLVVTAVAAMSPVAGAYPARQQTQSTLDCALCHVCSNPSAADPCLKMEVCPRHAVSEALDPESGPDEVVLDQLENLYVPVLFDHAAHARMVEMDQGCETCHHFTPPNTPHPSCRECHPVSIQHEDLAQPGLKGAYHRQCMGCHTDWDHDTKCEICHAKKAGGALQGTATTFTHDRHYQQIEMKDLIVFETEYDEGDKVPFHHRNHAEKYEMNCALCHQQQSCAQCHVHGAESHPMGELQDVDMHDTCYICHQDNECEECHGRDPDDLFEHADTGWPLKPYHADLHCRACHGSTGPFNKPEPECSDCHGAGPGTRPTCDACHDDDRSYDARSGFGEG